MSGLLGQAPNITFDVRKFFASSYYSPIMAEMENNIKIVAERAPSEDKEAFYARFIGVGLVSYAHDTTWYTIFGSQLSAMEEMNRRGLITVSDVQAHYEKAVSDSPDYFANYSFEQRLRYMQERSLIAQYPSDMIEILFNGRDFLRYLSHTGRNCNDKIH